MGRLVREAAPQAEHIASTPEGRCRATAAFASTAEHLSPDLVATMIRAAAACDVRRWSSSRAGRWNIDAASVDCPVRLVWGSDDRLLTLPDAAVRYREEWFPQAEWVEIDGAGHCPPARPPAGDRRTDRGLLRLGDDAPRLAGRSAAYGARRETAAWRVAD